MRARLLSVVLLLVASLAATFAFAGPITVVPTDLSVGARYQLVFVTSTGRDASSSDIEVYNAIVSFVAGVPVYDLCNTIVANDNAGQWSGAIANPVSCGEPGTSLSTVTWTGSVTGGTAYGGRELGGLHGDRRQLRKQFGMDR